jgi:exosortase A-associated hydrolase 2
MSHIKEDIFFFEGSNNRKLLGFLHKPIGQSRNIGILYCHPFADEQNLSHRIAVNTSRTFAREGFAVLRFDMSGCGDSMAELGQVTINDWLEDISCAIKLLKEKYQYEHIVMWGIRLGGGLAILKASQLNEISALVLMNPIIDFKEYINNFFRRKMLINNYEKLEKKKGSGFVEHEDGKIDILGYTISNDFYEEMISIGGIPSRILPKCKMLLLTISLMDNSSIKYQKYFQYQSINKSMVTMKHVKAETFWDRYWRWECKEIADITLNWLISDLLV